MGVKTLVGLPYQFAVEALFAPAGFVSRLALRLGSKAKATRHSPSAA